MVLTNSLSVFLFLCSNPTDSVPRGAWKWGDNTAIKFHSFPPNSHKHTQTQTHSYKKKKTHSATQARTSCVAQTLVKNTQMCVSNTGHIQSTERHIVMLRKSAPTFFLAQRLDDTHTHTHTHEQHSHTPTPPSILLLCTCSHSAMGH